MYMMYSCVWCSLFLSKSDVGVHVERGGRGEGEKGRRSGGGGDERKGASREGQREWGRGRGCNPGVC